MRRSLIYKTHVWSKAYGSGDIEAGLYECGGNGHPHFSLCSRGTRYNSCSNDQETRLRDMCPELTPLLGLHLCDHKGAPMYAVENGHYHLWNSGSCPKQSDRIAMVRKYLRCSKGMVEELLMHNNEEYFRYVISVSDLPRLWQRQADLAITTLESLAKEEWDRDYVWPHSNFTPMQPDLYGDIDEEFPGARLPRQLRHLS